MKGNKISNDYDGFYGEPCIEFDKQSNNINFVIINNGNYKFILGTDDYISNNGVIENNESYFNALKSNSLYINKNGLLYKNVVSKYVDDQGNFMKDKYKDYQKDLKKYFQQRDNYWINSMSNYDDDDNVKIK